MNIVIRITWLETYYQLTEIATMFPYLEKQDK